ncbi:hypothetical protein KR009_007098, partial [Drosophila setifemur]
MYKIIVMLIPILCLFGSGLGIQLDNQPIVTNELVKFGTTGITLFSIEGTILAPDIKLNLPETWMSEISLSINNGEFKGFVRLDGRFLISAVPNGSHVLHVDHPDVHFHQVRVEITGKGKYRARKVNYIQPSVVTQLAYPLRLQPIGRRRYFLNRQQWQIVDVILNPMILVLVVPVILMMVVTRVMSDPEAKMELESISMPKIMSDVPDFGDMLSSFLSGKKAPIQAGPMRVAEKTKKK